MNFLPVKSEGRTAMTSDFVTVLDGSLHYNSDTWEEIKEKEEIKEEIKKHEEERARRAGAILDVSSDGYYNAEKCIKDFEKASFSFICRMCHDIIIRLRILLKQTMVEIHSCVPY